MQSVFFRAICQMGTFMICAQAIVHFRPDKSYEKYMKLLVSIMILVQIFLPVKSLFSGSGQETFSESVKWFQEQLEQSMEQAQGSAVRSQELLEEMTLLEVQERLTQESGMATEDEDNVSDEEGIKPVEPVKIE